ncbi:NAD(P)/FAD-dependent oxidoreductase [soil metagenome]
MKKITLVGAGLAGSLLSIYLAKKGYHVNVFERRSDMRKAKVEAGRSINLALSTRGIHALKEIGLYDEIKKIAIPMYGRMMHAVDGSLTFQRYGKDDSEYINSVSRAELNIKLLSLADKFESIKIFFNQRCAGFDPENGYCYFTDEITGETKTVSSETIIGTDGSSSALRMDMLKLPGFNFSQEYLKHGYKELTIPAGFDKSFRMEKNALHIWPRGSFMLIALPNIDGSFTCTLFHPYDGDEGLNSLNSELKIRTFFEKYFPDTLELIPDLVSAFLSNPTGSLITIKCDPWYYKDVLCLLGDSSHAILPFFGQGMNAAFEDCTVLDKCLDEFGNDWNKIYPEFFKRRKINTDSIADLASENFIEMRDKVGDEKFLLKKKVEHILEERYPGKFIPKYSMVTFHRMPYSVAKNRGLIQEKILDKLVANISEVEKVDMNKADMLIGDYLSDLEYKE